MLPVSSSQFFRQIMECYKTLLSLWVGLIVTPLSITLLFYLISLSSLCCSTFLAIHVLSHVYRMHWGLVFILFLFFQIIYPSSDVLPYFIYPLFLPFFLQRGRGTHVGEVANLSFQILCRMCMGKSGATGTLDGETSILSWQLENKEL